MKITAIAPWFGSKRMLAPFIVEQLGEHRSYVEPFCGSMSVLLAKSPCSFEMVNDLHGDLTNLAWVIQDSKFGPRLYRYLRRTVYNEATFTESKRLCEIYPLAKSQNKGEINLLTAQRAYHYFVLCWMGRSGIAGTKSCNNTFTVRYTANGGTSAVRYQSAVNSIPAWRRRLRNVTILRRDGFKLIDKLADEQGVAIYCDPPYLQKNGQYVHDLSEGDHVRLSHSLSRFRHARVVVSYYDHPRLADLYPARGGWSKLDCHRTKHLAVQGRRGSVSAVAPEVLLINGPIFGERGRRDDEKSNGNGSTPSLFPDESADGEVSPS